jgi:hypothetical protein
MADHGQLINSRTYWTYTGPDGKQAVSDTPPGGSPGVLGTGIGGSAAPKSTQYQEQTYEDGTTVLSRWDPDATQWTQESVTVDPGLRGQKKDADAAQAAATKAGQETPTAAETARHNNATEAQAANTASRADRREQQQITAAEAQQRATALREERANAVATGRLTLDAANAEYDRRYKDEVETPLKRSAEQRAVEAAKRAEDQARFEREKFQQEQVSSREKETTRRQEAEAKFSYDAGQDAVSQAMKLLPYRVGPTFGAEFSQALNTLGNGGGAVNFTPGAVTFDAPDYASIAEQAAQRAHALFNLPAPAAPGMPAAPAAPAPVAAPGVPVAPPTGLPVTPANRDVYAR